MLGDEVPPDCFALSAVQTFKANRVIEAAANRLVHRLRRRVGYPNRRNLHLVKYRICNPLLCSTTAAKSEAETKGTESTGISAEQFVGLIDDYHTFGRIFLLIADANSYHTRFRLHIFAVLVTLGDFV